MRATLCPRSTFKLFALVILVLPPGAPRWEFEVPQGPLRTEFNPPNPAASDTNEQVVSPTEGDCMAPRKTYVTT
jgi:hypothetical protein